MKIVVQRVKNASVSVNEKRISSIGHGFLLYVCIEKTDTEHHALKAATKICTLRIMPDEHHSMNASLKTTEGELLIISQFTLCADTSGRRPSFFQAAPADIAKRLLSQFTTQIRQQGIPCKTGEFGQHMSVSSVNDGPVTLILDI